MSDLGVVGQPLRVGCKFQPRLSMRRIYNKKCFRVERYQHEVANHYRDIQLQQSTMWHQQQQPGDRRQLPHRQQQPKYRPRTRLRPLAPMAVSSSSVQFRCELPIHVQYYPRSGITYAPRGRQTICSALPPVEIYNDTVQRIRSAQSCDQLKAFVQRQLN